jgi:hypothetical protein
MSKFRSGDNHQVDPALPKLLKQASAPEETTRQPVQAMEHTLIHLAPSDQGQQPLKCGTVGSCAGIPVVLETLFEQHPPVGALRAHKRIAGLELDLA